MAQIDHEIKVKASAERIARALTTAAQLEAWHGGKVTSVDGGWRFDFADGAPTFEWAVDPNMIQLPAIESDLFNGLQQGGINVLDVRCPPAGLSNIAYAKIKPQGGGDAKPALAIMLTCSKQGLIWVIPRKT